MLQTCGSRKIVVAKSVQATTEDAHSRAVVIRLNLWATMGAIHSTKISGNFGPYLSGSVWSNLKSFEKTGSPFEVDHFSRSDRLEFWGAIHSTKIPTGPTGKSGPPQKVDPFFRNFCGWTEPIHCVSDRNFRKFWLNGSRPWLNGSRPMTPL